MTYSLYIHFADSNSDEWMAANRNHISIADLPFVLYAYTEAHRICGFDSTIIAIPDFETVN